MFAKKSFAVISVGYFSDWFSSQTIGQQSFATLNQQQLTNDATVGQQRSAILNTIISIDKKK